MAGGHQDDGIEFLVEDHPNKMLCQICSDDIAALSENAKSLHYEQHFQDQAGPSESSQGTLSNQGATVDRLKSASKKFPLKIGFKPSTSRGLFNSVSVEKQNVFWHSLQTSEPPANFSPGLIPVLKKALLRSHAKGGTQKAWLAFEHAVHIHKESWDRIWGCGYRNYLMVCAALMDQEQQPLYFPLLDSPTPPGVRNLQVLLEEAWRNGFDDEGAQQLHHKLVDTCKWIGTGELYVAFTYRGVPAKLVDFNGGIEPLLQWIYDYFSGGDPQPKGTTVGDALRGAQPVIITDKLPIVLQHQGHSRTIVGCERVKNGTINLLTFDPSRRILSHIRQAGLQYHNSKTSGRHGTTTTTTTTSSSSSSVLRHVIHPMKTVKSKKRKSVEHLPKENGPKRKRPSDPGPQNGDEVIVIDSDSDAEQPKNAPDAKPDELDPGEVLKLFRLSSRLLRKDKYQILYFPLEEPLTEQEKLRRHIVMSERVTQG
ncbi:peptidase family C78-domain-containing protein [Trametes elegans]|nr:peptidase family C78-domain-containing protein [Trametes elegans]